VESNYCINMVFFYVFEVGISTKGLIVLIIVIIFESKWIHVDMSRVFSYQRFMWWWPEVCVSFHVCFSSFLSLHLQPFICLKLDVKGSEIHLNGALDSSNFELCFSFLTHQNSSLWCYDWCYMFIISSMLSQKIKILNFIT